MIDTSATEGVVSTQNFGEPFHPDLVEAAVTYQVHVHVPRDIREDNSAALLLKLEKVSIPGGLAFDKCPAI